MEDGGGLIATEQAGLYDEWRRLRVKPGLEGLVENQPLAPAYEERVMATTTASGSPARREFGRGRVVYFPGIDFDGSLPAPGSYFSIDQRFWKRPSNSEEVINAVRWAARDDMPLVVTGPEFLIANLTEQQNKRRRLVHLVNYNTKRASSIAGIEVKCAVPEGHAAKGVTLFSADSVASQSLSFRMEGSMAVFTVPELGAYGMMAVSW